MSFTESTPKNLESNVSEMVRAIARDNNILLINNEFGEPILQALGLDPTLEDFNGGVCVLDQDQYMAFYKKDATRWEKTATIMHEIGHALFNHLGQGGYIDSQKERIESEARIFSVMFTTLCLYEKYRNAALAAD